MTLLKVENVGKVYRVYPSEWRRIAHWFGFSSRPPIETWVLRNIHFNIHPGEAIGIIGKNGAGKSTLLKILTGIIKPSEGRVTLKGRIASLELGMGFDPELSGRKNISHSLSLMGFSAREIKELIPQIEAFAEIDVYLDQPVRIYSSGTQLRLAFAIATARPPDIFVIDEAMSVGDMYFQKKCLDRIREMLEEGTSLVLVSHSMEIIREFTDRSIFINRDNYIFDDTDTVIKIYEQELCKAS